MRTSIEFLLPHESLIPYNHNYHITSWIYHVLKEGNPSFSDFLHNEGISFQGKQYKPFTFSRLQFLNKAQFRKEGILATGKVKLDITSPLEEFKKAFTVGIYDTPFWIKKWNGMDASDDKEDPVEKIGFDIQSVTVSKNPLFQEHMEYELVTPLVHAQRRGSQLHFAHPLESSFYEGVIQSSLNRYHAVCTYQGKEPLVKSTDDIRFEFTNTQHFSLAKAAKLEQFQKKKIKGYQWSIRVTAPPSFHEFIYQCGMGQLTNQGFGMLQVKEV